MEATHYQSVPRSPWYIVNNLIFLHCSRAAQACYRPFCPAFQLNSRSPFLLSYHLHSLCILFKAKHFICSCIVDNDLCNSCTSIHRILCCCNILQRCSSKKCYWCTVPVQVKLSFYSFIRFMDNSITQF